MVVVMARKKQSAFGEWLMGQFRRPDHLLTAARYYWQDTHNPAYVWWAINICTRQDTQIEFPEWVSQYLAGCAQRMMSSNAAAQSDLRKVLPQILGFPRKRGRGNLLDMGKSVTHYNIPAIRFAIEIERGVKTDSGASQRVRVS